VGVRVEGEVDSGMGMCELDVCLLWCVAEAGVVSSSKMGMTGASGDAADGIWV